MTYRVAGLRYRVFAFPSGPSKDVDSSISRTRATTEFVFFFAVFASARALSHVPPRSYKIIYNIIINYNI